jgi:hypothetical protein
VIAARHIRRYWNVLHCVTKWIEVLKMHTQQTSLLCKGNLTNLRRVISLRSSQGKFKENNTLRIPG